MVVIFGRVVLMIEEISCGRISSIAWVTPCSIGDSVLFPFGMDLGEIALWQKDRA